MDRPRMDEDSLDRDHWVARYVAGQLDATETAAFEARYAQDPDIVRDIERTMRLREGLAVLKERGELDSLLRTSWQPYWFRRPSNPALGLAAAVAALAIGLWLWAAHLGPSPLAETPAAFSEHGSVPLHVAFTQTLVRTRGAEAPVEIALPAERGAIELRMFPSSRQRGTGFHLLLGQLDAANAVAPVADMRVRANAEDGFVVAYLDSAKLSRGRYVLDLVPERPSDLNLPADRFVIELR